MSKSAAERHANRIPIRSHGDRGRVIGFVRQLQSGAWSGSSCFGLSMSPFRTQGAAERFVRDALLANTADIQPEQTTSQELGRSMP